MYYNLVEKLKYKLEDIKDDFSIGKTLPIFAEFEAEKLLKKAKDILHVYKENNINDDEFLEGLNCVINQINQFLIDIKDFTNTKSI